MYNTFHFLLQRATNALSVYKEYVRIKSPQIHRETKYLRESEYLI